MSLNNSKITIESPINQILLTPALSPFLNNSQVDIPQFNNNSHPSSSTQQQSNSFSTTHLSNNRDALLSSRNIFIDQLLEGLTNEEQSASILCTQVSSIFIDI
jgi:hypothetical protein